MCYYNCTVYTANLTYISMLIIFCIIVYVTNKILIVYPFHFYFLCVCVCVCVCVYVVYEDTNLYNDMGMT